jgi:hypothetical protein
MAPSAGAASLVGVAPSTGNPLTLPLVNSGNLSITYLGQFALPSNGNFDYNGSLSVSPDGTRLYISGLQQSQAVHGCITIPSLGGTATQVYAPTVISAGSNNVSTGSLLYNNKLYVTSAISYDATGSQTAFLTPMNADLTGQGSPCGAAGSASSIARLFSNSMAQLPAVWETLFRAQWRNGIRGRRARWLFRPVDHLAAVLRIRVLDIQSGLHRRWQ